MCRSLGTWLVQLSGDVAHYSSRRRPPPTPLPVQYQRNSAILQYALASTQIGPAEEIIEQRRIEDTFSSV